MVCPTLTLALTPTLTLVQVRGTRSCPALAVYDPDQLDTQLDVATRAFCSDRVTVQVG